MGKKRFIYNQIMVFFLICSFAGIFYTTTLFNVGYHNLDLAQNMRFMEEATGLKIIDFASDYNAYTPKDGYIRGSNQIDSAYTKGVFFGIIFGLSLAYFFSKK